MRGSSSATQPTSTSSIREPEATAIDTQANGRPRLAFSEPSTGSIDDPHLAASAISSSPRSSETAVSGTPSASISAKIASSAARSIT